MKGINAVSASLIIALSTFDMYSIAVCVHGLERWFPTAVPWHTGAAWTVLACLNNNTILAL